MEMSDPRNVAHEKKVKQEKAHEKPESDSGGKAGKTRRKKAAAETASGAENPPSTTALAIAEQAPGELEKSVAVLSKLKEMEFHSRANIETLAGLSLTIEDELKQQEFAQPIGELYAAQDGFRTRIAALIESYEAKCESLKPSA